MPLSQLSGIQLSLFVAEFNSPHTSSGPRAPDQCEHAHQSEQASHEDRSSDAARR